MNSTEDVKKVFDKSPYKFYLKELSDYLRWINERAVPLTGCMLGISMLYILAFMREEQIPLSLSSVTTILPALFLLLVIFLGLSISMLMSPLCFLLISNKPKEIDSDHIELKINNSEIVNRLNLLIQWGCVNTIIIITILISASLYNKNVIISIVIVLLSPIFGATLYFALKKDESNYSLHDRVSSIIILLPQVLISVLIFMFTYDKFISTDELVKGVFLTFGLVYFVAFIQVLGVYAIGFSNKSSKPSLINISCCFVALIVFLGIFPSSSAFIAKALLNTAASGSRACTVFTLKKNELNSDYEHLKKSKNELQTLPLQIIHDADGIFYVRLKFSESKKLEFIPRSIVTGMDNCSKK